MRYNISCCRNCEMRYPGCSCMEYQRQKQELLETKETAKHAKKILYIANGVMWASQQHKRTKFY